MCVLCCFVLVVLFLLSLNSCFMLQIDYLFYFKLFYFIVFCFIYFIFVVPQFMFYATNRLFILFYFIVFCFVLFILFLLSLNSCFMLQIDYLFYCVLFCFVLFTLFLLSLNSCFMLHIDYLFYFILCVKCCGYFHHSQHICTIFVLFNFQSSCYFVKFAKGIKILFNCVYLGYCVCI